MKSEVSGTLFAKWCETSHATGLRLHIWLRLGGDERNSQGMGNKFLDFCAPLF
jgi:hypothetical protein